MFQRNEAAQDVPVALATKLSLSLLKKKKKKSATSFHHFQHFPVKTSLPAWQKQLPVSEIHTPHCSQQGKDLLF